MIWILLVGCDPSDNRFPESCDEEVSYFVDFDGDGFGAPEELWACEVPADGVDNGDDCDDDAAEVNPDARDICDGVDDDCTGDETGCLPSGTWVLGAQTLRLRGGQTSEAFGTSLAAPDLDGDGQPELVVGDPQQQVGGAGVHEGAVWVFPGDGTEDLSAEEDAVRLLGPNQSSYAGSSLAWGDLDGDGDDELAVGAPFDNPDLGENLGAVYIVDGLPTEDADLDEGGLYLWGLADDEAGSSLAFPGDVNGDGHAELIVGAPDWEDSKGAAFMMLGPITADKKVAWSNSEVFYGNKGGDAGHAVAGAGDVNGDGLPDVLVGSPNGWDYKGAAYIVHGPTTSHHLPTEGIPLKGVNVQGQAGWAVAGLGDVNGDGLGDIAVSSPRQGDENKGRVFILHGPLQDALELKEAPATLSGDQVDGLFGYNLVGAGDIDGDGLGEVLVGAPGDDHDTGNDSGALYLFYAPYEGALGVNDSPAWWIGEGAEHAASPAVMDAEGRLLMAAPEGQTAYLFSDW